MPAAATISRITLEGQDAQGNPYKKVIDVSPQGTPMDAIAFTDKGVAALGAWYEAHGGGKMIDHAWVKDHFGVFAADHVIGVGQQKKVDANLLHALWTSPKHGPNDATPAYLAKLAINNPTNG